MEKHDLKEKLTLKWGESPEIAEKLNVSPHVVKNTIWKYNNGRRIAGKDGKKIIKLVQKIQLQREN